MQAVQTLSGRVDSVNRRLESVEGQMNELSDVNRRVADVGCLEQRITALEQSANDRPRLTVDEQSGAQDGVHSTRNDLVDGLMKQLNNLTARMTLAENQLRIQVNNNNNTISIAP